MFSRICPGTFAYHCDGTTLFRVRGRGRQRVKTTRPAAPASPTSTVAPVCSRKAETSSSLSRDTVIVSAASLCREGLGHLLAPHVSARPIRLFPRKLRESQSTLFPSPQMRRKHRPIASPHVIHAVSKILESLFAKHAALSVTFAEQTLKNNHRFGMTAT